MVFIVPRDGVELDFGDIGDWAADRLARFKVPRFYQQIEALPKTSTQKIAKHLLRAGVDDPSKGYDRDLATTTR
jgi:crotonobetaine/carnitine-CoA ligase